MARKLGGYELLAVRSGDYGNRDLRLQPLESEQSYHVTREDDPDFLPHPLGVWQSHPRGNRNLYRGVSTVFL